MTNSQEDKINPPLWEVMKEAYTTSSGTIVNYLGEEELQGPDCYEFAAMIRAIAGEMIMKFDPWLAEHSEVVDWLYSEADRAENGKE